MAFMAFSSDASTHPDIPNLFPSEDEKKDMEVTAYEKAYWPCHVTCLLQLVLHTYF